MMPSGIGVIDTLIGFPNSDYSYVIDRTKDAGSKELSSPVAFLFHDRPHPEGDPVGATLEEMDRWGVERGLINLAPPGDDAMRRYPDRFIPSVMAGGPSDIRRAYETWGIRAVTAFPAGSGIPIDDARMYPVYATCVELGVPIFCTAGVPGPRLPLAPQRVDLIDQVMYDFPELVFVTRHGCEPWAEMAVKLMLKWPGLYYSTSAFAPRHYPRAVIDYANTRGAHKVLYAGYFPMGLSLQRIMEELDAVPFRAEVWPQFLRGNAMRVLGLESP